jgi:CelD/BcsL family acetyltransferase involved in cellulose biosynthesis
MLEIRHFVGRHGVDSLEGDWRSLLTRLPRRRHFHYPEWYRAYLDGYAADEGELHLFAAYDSGTLLAVLPLRYERERLLGLPLRHYSLLSGDNIALADITCDPTVPIDSILTALNTYLAGNRALSWDMISFRHILEESPLLASSITGLWRTLLRPHRGCFNLVLDQPYETYFQTLSKNTRSSLNRARKKLTEAGGGTYLSTRDPAQLLAYYQEFLEVEASGWKGAHGSGTAIKLNPAMDRFFRSLLKYFGHDGRCEIQLLKLGESTISGQFCLAIDGTLYNFKTGFREEYARLAPGQMLSEQLLMHNSGRKTDIRNFNLVTDPPGDRMWRPQRLQVSNLYAFNCTAMGALAYAHMRARHKLSRLLHRTDQPEPHTSVRDQNSGCETV